MASLAELQASTLQARAEEDHVFGDLLYFYGAQRNFDKLDALVSDLDPKNEADLLAWELFQGTDAKALVPLLKADAPPWIRYSLLKALLRDGSVEAAMGLWKKSLQWQNPDLLLVNTLIQFALQQDLFEEAQSLLEKSKALAPGQPELTAWCSQATSRTKNDRTLYLDPLPAPMQVAFFLTTQEAGPYLEDTLGGVVAQNFPLSEIILVDNGAAEGLANLQQQYPIRVIDGAAGGLPEDVEATHFATVPPTAAPALDFVQQFVLALENGPENAGRISGRIEDFYQDSPGDKWRVTRLNAPMSEQRDAGPNAPTSGATFQSRHQTAAAIPFYLPEAVACGLRQDTLDSAMTAYWKSNAGARQQAGHFGDADRLVYSFTTHLDQAVAFINDDVDTGRSSLIFPDFLCLFHGVVLDAKIALAQGILDSETAAHIQNTVIDSIQDLDNKYKRDLTGKVRKALEDHLVAANEATSLPPEVAQNLDAFVKKLNALYNGMNQDLYLALYG